jgi:hypothetical protein
VHVLVLMLSFYYCEMLVNEVFDVYQHKLYTMMSSFCGWTSDDQMACNPKACHLQKVLYDWWVFSLHYNQDTNMATQSR